MVSNRSLVTGKISKRLFCYLNIRSTINNICAACTVQLPPGGWLQLSVSVFSYSTSGHMILQVIRAGASRWLCCCWISLQCCFSGCCDLIFLQYTQTLTYGNVCSLTVSVNMCVHAQHTGASWSGSLYPFFFMLSLSLSLSPPLSLLLALVSLQYRKCKAAILCFCF